MEYVQKLLDERDKYERIVTQSFRDDKTFRTALNQVGLSDLAAAHAIDALNSEVHADAPLSLSTLDPLWPR